LALYGSVLSAVAQSARSNIYALAPSHRDHRIRLYYLRFFSEFGAARHLARARLVAGVAVAILRSAVPMLCLTSWIIAK
jgi:hypothetical protein